MSETGETKENKTPLFTKILVEIKGEEIVNINDLPKEHYEHFLSLMEQVRIVYITANITKKTNE